MFSVGCKSGEFRGPNRYNFIQKSKWIQETALLPLLQGIQESHVLRELLRNEKTRERTVLALQAHKGVQSAYFQLSKPKSKSLYTTLKTNLVGKLLSPLNRPVFV